MDIPHLFCPSIQQWTRGLLPRAGSCEQSYYERTKAHRCLLGTSFSIILGTQPKVFVWGVAHSSRCKPHLPLLFKQCGVSAVCLPQAGCGCWPQEACWRAGRWCWGGANQRGGTDANGLHHGDSTLMNGLSLSLKVGQALCHPLVSSHEGVTVWGKVTAHACVLALCHRWDGREGEWRNLSGLWCHPGSSSTSIWGQKKPLLYVRLK